MTKRESDRVARLLPNGKPRWIRVYDNGGETADRYTCVFTGRYTHKTGRRHWFVGMSAHPYHPQGVGMHGEDDQPPDTRYGKRGWGWPPAVGRKHPALGKRINFEDLPEDCQLLVTMDYIYLWDLPGGEKHPSAADPFQEGWAEAHFGKESNEDCY